MKMWRLFLVGGVVSACVLAASTGSSQEGIGERIGKTVDETIEQIRREAGGVAGQIRGQIREGFEEARAAVDRMSVTARVYARIRWDKRLSGGSVSVDVAQGGRATLRGTVPTVAAKAKAGELAGQTTGVESVRNELEVLETATRDRRSR